MVRQMQTGSRLWGIGLSFGIGIGTGVGLGMGLVSGAIALAVPPSPRATVQPLSPPHPLSTADRPRFYEILDRVRAYHTSKHEPPKRRPLNQVLQDVAGRFLGAPYSAGLLDRTRDERLVINLRQFDCLIFVETVLAFGRTMLMTAPESARPDSAPSPTRYFTASARDKASLFSSNLESLRYRDGKRQDYCSRLHYFADWVSDNQGRGLVRNLTSDLGGRPLVMSFDFMSRNRSLYPALWDDGAYACIQRVEARLNGQRHYYLPTAAIRSQYGQLKSGDIVAVATRVRGLDVTHVGLVYRDRGQVGLIHAAPGSGVKISPDLEHYVSRVEDSIGVIVARPLDPSR